jgi:hypothetical protein
MKHLTSDWSGKTDRVSFCSVATDVQTIEISGLTLVPNEDIAYVEFFMSHAFGVKTKYKTAIMPEVVANSYKTLEGKVFNLAHLMRNYAPKQIPRDRILGYVKAVEFVAKPENGWDFNNPPAIRAVAVMHKAAENVIDILASWFTGKNPIGGEWTVSMESSFPDEECGFLVYGDEGVGTFVETTPENLRALGCTYVPCLEAPMELIGCLNTEADDKRDGMISARICREYLDQEVVYLLGGLNGSIRYRGVGLTPASGAMEDEAKISTMLASAPMVDVKDALSPLMELGERAVALLKQ